MLRSLGDTSFGPEYERETFVSDTVEHVKANRVHSKGRNQPSDLLKLALTPKQVRLQTRTVDGPKGMFGTFVHILKNDSVLGLYRGVCLPNHLRNTSFPP